MLFCTADLQNFLNDSKNDLAERLENSQDICRKSAVIREDYGLRKNRTCFSYYYYFFNIFLTW